MSITFYRAVFDTHGQKAKAQSSEKKKTSKKINASKADGNVRVEAKLGNAIHMCIACCVPKPNLINYFEKVLSQ